MNNKFEPNQTDRRAGHTEKIPCECHAMDLMIGNGDGDMKGHTTRTQASTVFFLLPGTVV